MIPVLEKSRIDIFVSFQLSFRTRLNFQKTLDNHLPAAYHVTKQKRKATIRTSTLETDDRKLPADERRMRSKVEFLLELPAEFQ